MQAYAYCGCYYTLPKSIADCANQQLQPQAHAQNITTLLATNTTPSLKPISSELPAGAVTANKEPTPSYLIPSEDSIPATNQDFPTTSDPEISAASQNNPDSDTTWSVLNVEPSIGAELSTATVISTYTTTIYTTTITTAATITTRTITISAPINTTTVYTCSSSDVTIPAVESSIPSVEPAARNGSAVCAGCRRGRRSKII